ncbi:MAG: excinuclease subunit [Patescibacteria group bacterium]|nr:excinuclease subunit [Patescibacteria group bacterium]
MNKELQHKLADLPKEPGVYFHKDAAGEIIYVGKAAVLRNRVRQYFQKSRGRDPKTEALVVEIVDTDWMVVESELEALFLEAEMIRRYMPKYNILLRDDKSMAYIRIDYSSEHPTVTTTRRPLDDTAKYFGPYLSTYAVREALKYLRKAFPFSTKKTSHQKRATLHYHLGLDPGLEEGKTSLEEYRANLRKLIAVIEGKRTRVIKDIEMEMKSAAKSQDFERAAKLRNQLQYLENLGKRAIFSDKEFLDISKDHALTELVDLLSLDTYPKRIEGYDISHQQGTDVVASMVVFTNGVSNKGEYRKFKTKRDHNNDFYNMHETIARRLSEKNRKAWGLPDILLIDGGKGQLDAALRARDELNQSDLVCIGLAKKEEQIVIRKPKENAVGSNVVLQAKALHTLKGFIVETDEYIVVNLPHTTNLVKLLQRIRDESHRFAVSYHSTLKRKRQTASALDDIPTIGPETRKKLLKTFGSVRGITQARDWELDKIVGAKKAAILRQYLRPFKKDDEA